MQSRALVGLALLLSACSGDDAGNNANNNASNNNTNNVANNSTNNTTNNGSGVAVDVSGVFAPGDVLRDAYTDATATVGDDGVVRFTAGSEGVVLIERDGATEPAFDWDNAIVYFLMLDRFQNGDTTNDLNYGRERDGEEEIGTFHGGDLKGLTDRLDYIAGLGVNVIWTTAFYEQIHGWVGGGGQGDFKHYAYAGYWPLDFTKMDANFGTEDELRTFVNEAHARGIRVVLDVVANHVGYATPRDLVEFGVDVVDPGWETWEPGPGGNYFYFDALFDRNSENWLDWWGNQWIRVNDIGPSGPNAYPTCPPTEELRECVGFLPDLQTNNRGSVGLPPFFANKPDTNAVELENARVRDYLVEWLTRWVRDFGIDGFRVDTAKHVELDVWKQLHDAGDAALDEWRAANPSLALDDAPFWMTGEVFSYAFSRTGADMYHTEADFDSLINFEFQGEVKAMLNDYDLLDGRYAEYATKLDEEGVDTLTYISSHDTSLWFDRFGEGDIALQRKVGSALLLLPGSIQIFYGDESARPNGPGGSDGTAGTRSDMNWDTMDMPTVEHWRKLGNFRKRHPAVSTGAHTRIQAGAYAFSRVEGDDAVVVVFAE